MMLFKKDRLDRERRTIKAMVGIYCRGHHDRSGALCDECRQLLAYAMQRIDRCIYRDDKPTCAKCPIHCYKPAMREQVRRVMRYAGPRMMVYHPVLAFLHYMDEKTRTRKPKTRAKGSG